MCMFMSAAQNHALACISSVSVWSTSVAALWASPLDGKPSCRGAIRCLLLVLSSSAKHQICVKYVVFCTHVDVNHNVSMLIRYAGPAWDWGFLSPYPYRASRSQGSVVDQPGAVVGGDAGLVGCPNPALD